MLSLRCAAVAYALESCIRLVHPLLVIGVDV